MIMKPYGLHFLHCLTIRLVTIRYHPCRVKSDDVLVAAVEVLIIIKICGFRFFSYFLVCHFVKLQFYWSRLIRSRVLVVYTEHISATYSDSKFCPWRTKKKVNEKDGKAVDIASNISEGSNGRWEQPLKR